jgi:sodium transport system permease protein
MILGMGFVTGLTLSKMEKKVSKIVIVGSEHGGMLPQEIQQNEGFEIADVDNYEIALRKKEVQVVLIIPKGFTESVASTDSTGVRILYDLAEIRSEMAQKKLREVILGFRDEIIFERIEDQGIDKRFLEPFSVTSVNVASDEKLGGMVVGLFLPYLVIILSLSGAMYPAIDMTAGEKERGTLETLLVCSASRYEMVIGKFVTVFTASIITALLSLLSLFGTFTVGANVAANLLEGFPFSIQPLGIITVFLMILPLSALFSSILMMISIFAKTSKEANSYIHPLMFLVILPAIVSILPGIELSPRLALIPIVNTSLLLKEVLMGTYHWGSIGLIFFLNLFFASLGLFGAISIFQKEGVLFRV